MQWAQVPLDVAGPCILDLCSVTSAPGNGSVGGKGWRSDSGAGLNASAGSPSHAAAWSPFPMRRRNTCWSARRARSAACAAPTQRCADCLLHNAAPKRLQFTLATRCMVLRRRSTCWSTRRACLAACAAPTWRCAGCCCTPPRATGACAAPWPPPRRRLKPWSRSSWTRRSSSSRCPHRAQ